MVRSKWTKAVIVGLACAGAVRSQGPASNPPAAPAEQVLTLQENGKPRQPCRILQTWRLPDGSTAHLLQAQQTGEMLTVVESAQLSSAPQGSGGMRAVSTRIYHWGRSTTAPPGSPLPPGLGNSASSPFSGRTSGINQAGLTPSTSPSSSSLMPTTQTPSTNTMPRLAPTPITSSPPVPAQTQGCDTAPCVPAPKHGLFGLKSQDCACNTCNPCDSCGTQAPVVQEARPSLLSRLMHRSENCDSCSTACCDAPPASMKPTPTSVVQAPTAPAQIGDYRESWGKVEPWRPALTATETAQAPIKDSSWFRKKTVAEDSKKKHDDVANLPFPGADAIGGLPGGMPVVRPMGPPPPPPDPFGSQRAMASAYPVYRAPMMAADVGISKDMANAFTPGGTARPIPANFGQVEYPKNAFSEPDSEANAPAMAQGGYPQGGNAAMGMPPGATMPQFNAFYYPGMAPANAAAAMAASRQPTLPIGAMLPMGYNAAQPMTATPLQKPEASAPQARGTVVPTGAGLELAPTPQLVSLLRTSLYPSQREWAADCLAQQDCHNEPQTVHALVSAAKDDPAPAVRACCVRALAHQHINTPAVLAALQSLRTDTDAGVRREAEQALSELGAKAELPVESGLRPASAGR